MTGKRFKLTMGEFGEENIFDSTNEVEFTEISDMCNKMNEFDKKIDYLKLVILTNCSSEIYQDAIQYLKELKE